MANRYRNTLVQQIKDAGQELINRAESMVHPENDLITDFSIVIHFEQHEVPTIDYTTSVVNKVACDRVIYQKKGLSVDCCLYSRTDRCGGNSKY